MEQGRGWHADEAVGGLKILMSSHGTSATAKVRW